MKTSRALSAVLLWFLCVGSAALVTCGDDDDDDDDEECDEWVDDPITECDSVCTEETCAIAQECKDYLEIGSVENCIEDCFEGCRAGCFPVGTVECLEQYTDCETLIECLMPLFQF